MAKGMAEFNVAGTAIAIVKDGKIIHNSGYGVRSIATQEKVDNRTQFAIASNTKASTAAALAILVDEKILSWKDKVKKHIPEFKMYNAYVTENFTIEDLLTHRSGLGFGIGDLMFFPDGSNFTIDDIISRFQHFTPQSAFRTKFDYDNLLYIIAGEVIHRASGVRWEEFTNKRILRPLRMHDSFSGLASLPNTNNLAMPHTTESGMMTVLPHFVQDPQKINGAAGGILASVNDLCLWMQLHLNHGRYGENLDQQLFSRSRHD